MTLQGRVEGNQLDSIFISDQICVCAHADLNIVQHSIQRLGIVFFHTS
jgi:hypothetical protein